MQIPIPRGKQFFLSLTDKADGYLGMRQRNTVHHTGDRIALTDVLFQKFHTRGNIIKQIPHDNCRTLGAAGVLEQDFLSALDHIAGAGQFVLWCGWSSPPAPLPR